MSSDNKTSFAFLQKREVTSIKALVTNYNIYKNKLYILYRLRNCSYCKLNKSILENFQIKRREKHIWVEIEGVVLFLNKS